MELINENKGKKVIIYPPHLWYETV